MHSLDIPQALTKPSGEPGAAQSIDASPANEQSENPESFEAKVARIHRAFRCVCGQQVFMRNSQCVRCGRQLGFRVESGSVEAIEPAHIADQWRLAADDASESGTYLRCSNLMTPAACNWLLTQPSAAQLPRDAQMMAQPQALAPTSNAEPAPPAVAQLCIACSLNRMVPDWSVPQQAENWGRVELAKRRLVSSLLALGLPVRSLLTDDPKQGLAFDFLSAQLGAMTVMTGHEEGVITINVDEADDAVREAVRVRMHEPYRTMLGHLRHEVGHYYWDRLVEGSEWHEPYRALFGDETQDYEAALKRHYEEGPPADWALNFISTYASSHPWEDWAESWAHYLHMIDALGTARSFGLNFDSTVFESAEAASSGSAAVPDEAAPNPPADDFDRLFDEWLQFTQVLNEMSRSMGQHDFYPFVVAPPAREKLRFVHKVIMRQPVPPTSTANLTPTPEPMTAAPSPG